MKINDKEGQWSIDSIISIYRIIFFRIKRSLSYQPTTKGWMTTERQPIQIKSSTLRLKLGKESRKETQMWVSLDIPFNQPTSDENSKPCIQQCAWLINTCWVNYRDWDLNASIRPLQRYNLFKYICIYTFFNSISIDVSIKTKAMYSSESGWKKDRPFILEKFMNSLVEK